MRSKRNAAKKPYTSPSLKVLDASEAQAKLRAAAVSKHSFAHEMSMKHATDRNSHSVHKRASRKDNTFQIECCHHVGCRPPQRPKCPLTPETPDQDFARSDFCQVSAHTRRVSFSHGEVCHA